MLVLIISLSAAVLPSAIILWWFYTNDRYPEPPQVVLATFFLGLLAVVPVVVVALPVMVVLDRLDLPPMLYGLAVAFLAAAIPEEFFKFAVLRGYAMTHDEFNEPIDGLVYGVAASLGFATFENVMYVLQGGMETAIARALTAVPMHATLGAIMGCYCGQAKFLPERRSRAMFTGFAVAVVLHGIYDFPLLWLGAFVEGKEGQALTPLEAIFALALVAAAVATLLVAIVWALILAGRLRHIQEERAYRRTAQV